MKTNFFKSIQYLVATLVIACLFMTSSITSFASPRQIVFPSRIEAAVKKAAKKHNVPAKYVFAMILTENDRFDPYLRSSTRDSGITQINDANLDDFRSAGFKDVYNVEQNVEFGTMRLAWAYQKYGNWNQAYMVYNMGEGIAKKLFRKGITSSRYSRKTLKSVKNSSSWILENPDIIGRKSPKPVIPEFLLVKKEEEVNKLGAEKILLVSALDIYGINNNLNEFKLSYQAN